MALVQVRLWSVHPVVETIQDESSSGESAFETAGARTAVGCGGGDSLTDASIQLLMAETQHDETQAL